jgi:hypothetical protein
MLAEIYGRAGRLDEALTAVGDAFAVAERHGIVIGYFREYKGPLCLLGVVPAALYVANPWSVMVFVKFIGG